MDSKTAWLWGRPGRVVSSKVRDTIQAVKPSIMRVFMSTDKPVEFVPKGPDDVALAEQATDFIHHEFQRLNGYRVLNDLIHDALVKKQGIAKVYYKTYPKAKIHMFTDLTADELTLLVNEPGVEVLSNRRKWIGGRRALLQRQNSTQNKKASFASSVLVRILYF